MLTKILYSEKSSNNMQLGNFFWRS